MRWCRPTRACSRKNGPRRGDAGLTLLELLVVITILTLLTVAIGTVALNYLGGARADAARLQMTQIETGLDLFRLDIGRYPTSDEGLSALVEAPADADGWNGPYLRKEEALTDPWGAPFEYAAPGQDDAYDLTTRGADGVPGG
ncbi:MAG: type II secretion system major pseudopilin GspG [Pseudomonadota bacterium]